MRKIISLLLILFPFLLFSQTTEEINKYVIDNQNSIVREFESFFNVKIDQIDFETDDLSDYGVTDDELGIAFPQIKLVILSNQEKYIGYSLKTTNKKVISKYSENNKFVKSVMIHEIAHIYIDQIIDSLNLKISSTFGYKFIEEGIAEYCPTKMGEVITGDTFIPSVEEFENSYVRYKYGAIFVKQILDKYGLEKGIIILLKNDPPMPNEILNPNDYFDRILINI